MKPVIDSLIKEELEINNLNAEKRGDRISPKIITMLKKSV